jgi:hypothetical protein
VPYAGQRMNPNLEFAGIFPQPPGSAGPPERFIEDQINNNNFSTEFGQKIMLNQKIKERNRAAAGGNFRFLGDDQNNQTTKPKISKDKMLELISSAQQLLKKRYSEGRQMHRRAKYGDKLENLGQEVETHYKTIMLLDSYSSDEEPASTEVPLQRLQHEQEAEMNSLDQEQADRMFLSSNPGGKFVPTHYAGQKMSPEGDKGQDTKNYSVGASMGFNVTS